MLDLINLFSKYEEAGFSSPPAGTKIIELMDFLTTDEVLNSRPFYIRNLPETAQLEDIFNKVFIAAPKRAVRFALVQAQDSETAHGLIRRSLAQDVDLIILNIPKERSDSLKELIQSCIHTDHQIVDIQF